MVPRRIVASAAVGCFMLVALVVHRRAGRLDGRRTSHSAVRAPPRPAPPPAYHEPGGARHRRPTHAACPAAAEQGGDDAAAVEQRGRAERRGDSAARSCPPAFSGDPAAALGCGHPPSATEPPLPPRAVVRFLSQLETMKAGLNILSLRAAHMRTSASKASASPPPRPPPPKPPPAQETPGGPADAAEEGERREIDHEHEQEGEIESGEDQRDEAADC